MRNIKECLRLKFEADLSHEKIARALQLSKGVVSKYIKAARDTGIKWPALALLDDAALGAALVPAAKVVHTRGDRVLPDEHEGLVRDLGDYDRAFGLDLGAGGSL